jgi:hypothetical protein
LTTKFKGQNRNIVRIPTSSKGLGFLPKSELLPGVYLASSLTRAVNGGCVSSIINTTDTDLTLELPPIDLEGLDDSESALTLTFTAVAGSRSRLSSLRDQLRLDHLNSEDRASIGAI